MSSKNITIKGQNNTAEVVTFGGRPPRQISNKIEKFYK
jgi:hypothetical protein